MIQLADVVVKNALFGEFGQAFSSESNAEDFAQGGVEILRGIIGFIEIFVGAVAVFTLVIRGMSLIFSAGEEEELTKTKRHIVYALVGLIAIAISEVVVRGVVFPAAGDQLPDVNRGKYIMAELANFISGFIAIFAFVTLFYAGYRYVVSAGNEEETEKVKKAFVGALIALLLALGAFALVNTVVEFEPIDTENPLPESPDPV